MPNADPLREHIAKLIDSAEAHASTDAAIADMPLEAQGKRPTGLPHSPWELLEHIRITQRDILDFCESEHYKELSWPKEYWPATPTPPDAGAWKKSVEHVRADREAFRKMALDPKIDLLKVVPNGDTQTYLRELFLVADHNAYHVGELVLVRQLLGQWHPKQ